MTKTPKKNIETKLTPEQIRLYTNLAVFTIVLSAIAYVSLFLYQNFYLTITQSKEIMILQKKVITGTVNTNQFDKIIKKINEKNNNNNNSEIKNPFK